ncbi:ABC transporter ATP-binding protein/permease (plasmid) [Lachnospira eligens]|uniref:ATP-binding cassette, subfamily B, bacterial n=1 Tax=Lachnospira eligens (strain ATCC 27750 / DSM 3376 / VPI C15-48 / C15-B4) TaxID=515620 RepID=C4Z6I5_LACE2|nr:ABC transporter ATP-binding protein [Lachnospira eligens]ACR73577.1 ATP-binding cassette, subfamily B, bacterial [[Eubacterium] eligens ATCC 27750]UEA96435.1 ABC transporter ATP-binding protein/permease [Lachnospira eligens]
MKNKSVGKVILNTIKEKWLLTAGIAITVVGAIVMALFPPLILAKIIDTITSGTMPKFYMVLMYFGFLLITGLMESARETFLTVFGQKITHSLRSALMYKYSCLTTSGLTSQEPGTVVSRFVGDADTVENLFTSGIISMFADACKIISIVAVIWFKNKGLAIVLLVILPFLFVFTRIIQKNMLAAQIENRRAVGRASGHVPETLHNIRTIHTLGKENYMAQRYDEYICESYTAIEKNNFYDALYSPVILILNAIVVAVVMLFSASDNQSVLTFFGMSAGTAVAVINYISQIFAPVENLGMEIQTIQSAIAGVHRINEFFELDEFSVKKDLYIVENTAMAADSDVLVDFNNVTFSYDDDKNVVENLSFSIKKGEQVTLSGRTGAGKSTIFKLLLGLYDPDNGSVLIAGQKATAIPDSEKRKVYGYVEQTFHMVPGTVKDQITLYDTLITDEDVIEAAKTAGLHDAIMELENGYDTICKPEDFSQGQWQLLSIARAAAAKPELLLLDEITANLDADTEKNVLDALNRVSKNRTVISISHRTNAKMGRIIEIA